MTVSYLSQFIAKINDHLESTNKNINGITMTFLGQAINAAEECLAIPPNKDVWDDSVYDKYMAQCQENKRIAQALLPLEEKRLLASLNHCRDIKLSDCQSQTYKEKKNEIVKLWENISTNSTVVSLFINHP